MSLCVCVCLYMCEDVCEDEDVYVSVSEAITFEVISCRDLERGPSLITGHINMASHPSS